MPTILQDNIRCNRFELILQHVHLNDNSELGESTDRLHKLRPIIESLGESFHKHYPVLWKTLRQTVHPWKAN